MAKVEVVMPQMGESVMEGTVIEWAKQVGDTVEVDETLLEVATDKVDTEVPSPEAGVLVEILAEEDEVVEVGKPIAIIETDADAAGDVSSGGADEAEADEETQEESAEAEADTEVEEEPEPEEEAPAASGGGDEGERIEVQMPQMGESVVEATVIGWNKQVGDEVEEDETLLEISTDKVDSEVPSPASGTLVEILAEEEETIEVGQTIAVIATGKGAAASGGSSKPAPKKEEKTESTSSASAPKETETVAATTTSNGTEPQRVGSDGRFYSPLVRSIAKEEGISQEELESIEGSGQNNRVSKKDILAYVEDRKAGKVSAPSQQKQAASAGGGLSKPTSKSKSSGDSISAGQLDVKHSPSGDVEVIKMDRMRKMIAEHMVKSKQTSAHVTTFAEVDVTNMVKWRNANKAKFQEKTGTKLTFTPLFVEAIITAMLEYPLINSSVVEDEIHLKKDINFGLAVALGEGGEGGLIVPVIKKAQEKNLVGLANSVHDVAQKARSKKLSPDDLVGGTITLTNYGSVGNLMGTPIINQPQVAIIGTGAIEKRPVVREVDGQDVIAIRQMMFLSMSYDHRIIDGAHGGAFLNRIKEILENFDIDRSV
ncbi:2-oxoglutarate dehydrogenase, E2 component, dihydrolipoamide succinyltransferase [Gracilimonas sp.]|uniref:2-oxoglutarate dehydrogenase, E2 component, dihydrolipoamide succinyltransferase n=1 Tax=Gracilimonas sp. TaxID=1974203 RepID=UPI002872A84C|nr:2-oxoglutarate dehydrogenase, E2 component, dihydrolipoamide succinyltransferase [Gracilimonas sp.]